MQKSKERSKKLIAFYPLTVSHKLDEYIVSQILEGNLQNL